MMTRTMAAWTGSVLMTRIEEFGYIMAEMGRMTALELEARRNGDSDSADVYAKRAEMYRESAKSLKTDLNAQVTLKAA